MSLLDFITGGENENAQDALRRAGIALAGVQTPTQEQLTIPQLQQYVEAGIMTPAQAQAMMQTSNAYDQATGSTPAREAEMTALSQMQDISKQEGMTPQMQAALTDALNTANTNTAGQRGSILDQMAQKGIPTSLMGTAAQMATAGQDAQTANLAGVNAAGEAEQNALTAMSNAGNLSGNIENQNFGEQAQKAAAQNAIQQWNAANTTANNQFNASNTQQANAYNAQNKQNVANSNTTNANTRTQYNAQVPETVFQNAMQKATGQAGVNEAQANQATQAGQQEAGLIGGVIGGASQIGAAKAAPTPEYNFYDEGGKVPGTPEVRGDSLRNDKVHAMLSPGEIVIPRSVAPHPEMAKRFVQHLLTQKRIAPVHPEDVRSVLDALSSRRAA